MGCKVKPEGGVSFSLDGELPGNIVGSEASGVRIAFMVPQLGRGRSGVGDYASLLAGHLESQGHDCLLLSLNDDADQSSDEVDFSIKTVRLPGWVDRAESAKKVLDDFQPDWLSLQFVSYGFAKRGMVWGLGNFLRAMPEVPLQILFHEVWIGQMAGASWKDRVMGWLQLQSIHAMMKASRPRMVHSTNRAYQLLLQKQGYESKLLPLFGNIPLGQEGSDLCLRQALEQRGISCSAMERKDYGFFGIFGSLHPVWPAEPLFSLMRQAADASGKKVVIVSLGSIGAGEGLWSKLEKQYGEAFIFLKLGKLAEADVASVFGWLDYGIATTPYQVLGKSGSAAAFLEHGVPVIVNREEFYGLASDHESYDDPLVVKMDASLPDKLVQGMSKRTPRSRLPEVASQFMGDLEAAA